MAKKVIKPAIAELIYDGGYGGGYQWKFTRDDCYCRIYMRETLAGKTNAYTPWKLFELTEDGLGTEDFEILAEGCKAVLGIDVDSEF